jgi:putative DNA-invertase from lambdoid prophage Rac
MAVYGYTRVSTPRQIKGLSLDEQERRIYGRAFEQGWSVTAIFVEQGISGGVPFAERTQGSALLARLQPGDIIIAAKLDRCFRDAADGLATVRDLERRKVTLFLLDLGGDVVKNGIPRMLVTMFAAVAEFERHRIAERIGEGKAQQRLRGTFLGGRRPFGWQVAADGKSLVEDATEQAAIAEIYQAKQGGLSLRAIAARLNRRGFALSKSSVANILQRRHGGSVVR